ncbi:MAG: response regulator transcription factor [Paludibacteraceae bacterium]|nr:response regulator transcription factor [Paludibacteraceae bacterium]
MKKKSIVIIDTSSIIVEGLKTIIETSPEFKVSKIYRENYASVSIPLHGIDILLVDPRMSSVSQFSKFIHDCRTENDSMVVMALQTTYLPAQMLEGVDGVLELDDSPASIVSKLRNTSNKNAGNKTSDNCDLSQREKEVLVLVAKGLTNKEIADQLNLSVYTVITHRKNITAKTNIKSVSGLTIYALLNNLVTQSEFELSGGE